MNAYENLPDILIIDDNPDNLHLLIKILDTKGYRTRIVQSGFQVMGLVRMKPPDLILLDIMMPGLSGYDVCRQLKADEISRDIPVIFISVKDKTPDKLKGFEVGGADYITKPFVPEEVLARVSVHLRLRRQKQQLHEQNERYRALEQAAFDGIFMSENGKIAEVSDTMARMFGYSREELISRNIREFIPEYPETAREKSDSVTGRIPIRTFGARKDRQRFPLEIREKNAFFQAREVRVGVVRDLSREQALEAENRALRLGLDGRDHFGNMVGKTPGMRRVYERIANAAASDHTVLIYGQTGTGKELSARMIFELSGHHNRKFLSVNCSAVQEPLFESQFFGHRKGAFTGADRDAPGYFEQASGGTLFLDEIGEFTPVMQAKLLRVLQDGEYVRVGETESRKTDVRIIAATNRDLREMVRNGEMREDFFQRIHVIALELPRLNQRKEDIPLLVTHFLEQTGSGIRAIPQDLMEKFADYDWPGNVRELFNELRRYSATGEVELNGPVLKKEEEQFSGDTDIYLPEGRTFQEMTEDFERRVLKKALSQFDGNRKRVAEELGMPRKTLYRKISKYRLG